MSRIVTLALVLGAGAFMLNAIAQDDAPSDAKAKTVAAGASECPHGKGGGECTHGKGDGECPHAAAKLVASKDGACCAKSGECSSKSAKLVSTEEKKSECCAKGDGECPSKSAKLVSTDGKKSEACAKGDGECPHAAAKLVSTKDGECCAKGGECASKSAKLVSTEGKKSECSAKGECSEKSATLVSTKDGEACTKGDSACCEKSGECPAKAAVAKALTKLPKMTYLVGTESTCCSDSAAAIAKKSEKPVQFVVGKKTFDDKTAAMTALVSSTEKFVANFAKPHTCEKSGTTTVAGKACGCPTEAGAIGKLVSTSMDSVKMTYAVGDKSCGCPNEAKALAKESGKKTEFVVNGKKTCCNLTARLNLAQAKYVAAVEAIAKRDAVEAILKLDADADADVVTATTKTAPDAS